jgi:hypothetical protein
MSVAVRRWLRTLKAESVITIESEVVRTVDEILPTESEINTVSTQDRGTDLAGRKTESLANTVSEALLARLTNLETESETETESEAVRY